MANDRSIWDIIQSCLATIFACSWVAVHPNIPASEDGEIQVVARRLAIMGYMLLAPETVMMWVARQYLASIEISRRHQDKGWTRVHAFFLIMGGFMLYDGGKPLRVLEYREFEELLEQGKIDWPSITQQEISDKSKGDYLSKAIVILQTGWFVAQCIARGVNKLAITELEVVTLAFSMITMVVYALWWHKPLDVKVQVPIHLKERPTLLEKAVGDDVPLDLLSCLANNNHRTIAEQSSQPIRSSVTEVWLTSSGPLSESPVPMSPITSPHPIGPSPDVTRRNATASQSHTSSYELLPVQPHADSYTQVQQLKAGFTVFLHRQQEKHGILRGTLFVLFIYPFVPFFEALTDMFHCTSLDGKRFRVPTFYAPESPNETLGIALGFVLALAFGGIHCIAWAFYFPSLAERWIWRISAVLVSSAPVALVFVAVLADGDEDDAPESRMGRIFVNISIVFGMILLCAYMVSRLSLLILPLIELRALPPGAYVGVDWAALFPHI